MSFVSDRDGILGDIEICEREGDDLFLDLVRVRPWLYDKSHPGYSDRLMISNAWKDIASIIGDTAQNCESHWNRIKSNYNKEKMLKIKESKSGSCKSQRKPWTLFEQMKSFYEPKYHDNRISASNISTAKPRNCLIGKKVKNKQTNEQKLIFQAALDNVNGVMTSLVQAKDEKYEKYQTDLKNNPDKLFGCLVSTELNRLPDFEANQKYKEIMKLLSNLD